MLKPILPDYDIPQWRALPFPDRLAAVCRSWAIQGYGTPLGIYLLYGLKIAAYIGGWLAACTLSPDRDLANIATWWAGPEAFYKAIVWTALFEGLGLGCGSGPLTGRYLPPIGGPLYFLRPGTTKLPLFPSDRIWGLGHKRTVLDVLLYAADALAALGRALLAETIGASHLLPRPRADPRHGAARQDAVPRLPIRALPLGDGHRPRRGGRPRGQRVDRREQGAVDRDSGGGRRRASSTRTSRR